MLRHLLNTSCALLVLGVPLVATATAAESAATGPIPIDAFFAPSTMRNVRISPGGGHVAYIAPMQGRRGIALFDVATGKADVLVRAADEDIELFFWKGDDYIVFAADVGGNEALAYQSIHLPTRRIVRLIESFGENNILRQEGQHGYVIDPWSSNPKRILVYGSREVNTSSDYYAADVANGRRHGVLGQPELDRYRTRDLVFDQAGRLRVRVIYDTSDALVQARLGEASAFTTLFRQPRDLELSGMAHAQILADNRTLVFVDYQHHDRGALVKWDLDAGTAGGVLFEPPAGEITGVRMARDYSRVLGVTYQDEKPRVHWFDDTRRQLQGGVEGSFPGMTCQLLSWSEDEKRFVVHVESDRDPGGYFLLDRTGPKPRLMPLGAVNPKLDPKQLAPMEPVKFTARDGLEIHGYVVRPLGAKGPTPLIINPHGGPFGVRDEWGFDEEAQFLANRGYAVFKVNYRGSGGYGRRFLEAGRRQWGARMQDDLTDAVKWAVEQGIADPARVAIYGASYGGYAALAGAAYTPDLYRCAINYVGVSDLALLGQRDRGGSRLTDEIFYRLWVAEDPKVMRERSPLYAVERIRIPTLHAYGENDPRVEIHHWKRLRAELERLGKPYDQIRESDEGHGFTAEPARVKFYRQIEAFLAKHLAAPPR